MNFEFSEDRLVAALGQSRRVMASMRRKKMADGQWQAIDGEVFYTEAGVAALAAALGLVLEGAAFAALLEKTRGAANGAQDAPTVQPTPSAKPAGVTLRVLRQYANRHFWRCVNDAGQVVDLYEPKRPWLVAPRRTVRAVAVEGKTYMKLIKP